MTRITANLFHLRYKICRLNSDVYVFALLPLTYFFFLIFLHTLSKVTVMYLTESSGLSEAGWGQNSLQGAYHYTETLYSPTINCRGVPQGSTCGLRQEQELSIPGRQERLPKGQHYEEVDDEEEGEKICF